MTGVPRLNTTQQIHFFRKRVNFSDAGISAGVVFGTLPAGAMVTRASARLNTVFNAGTTNVLTVGTNSTAFNNIFAAADIDETTVGGYVAPAITAAANIFLVDTDLVVKYAQTGTAATTGQADIVVEYAPNMDQ